MLRWGVLLLFLSNALLLFWFGQQSRKPVPVYYTQQEGGELRLLSELSAGEVLTPRARECLLYSPFINQMQAQRFMGLFDGQPVTTALQPLPPKVIGEQLFILLPSDAGQRLNLLDRLASVGWVPESRQGRLVFGNYSTHDELLEVMKALPPELQSQTQIEPVRDTEVRYGVRLQYLSGYKISNKINQLIKNGWSEINFKKNAC